jgi:hypothetical protein
MVLALSLLVPGCGGAWQPVVYQPQPTAVANPAGEVKTLLNLRELPPVQVEVTDEYIKETFGSASLSTRVLPLATATFRIVTRNNVYQVAAYDPGERVIWAYRPVGRDLPTCQRMMNALYALTKRQP